MLLFVKCKFINTVENNMSVFWDYIKNTVHIDATI